MIEHGKILTLKGMIGLSHLRLLSIISCHYAILETRFASEKLPKRDKIIKRKLWQSLPQEGKARLEGFLDEDYSLDKFVDRIEHE